MNTENTVITVQDLESARESGRLSGEVRVLKWGAAIVVTMMFAYLTFLSQQINGVRSDLTQQIDQVHSDLTQRIDQVHSDLTQRIDQVRSDLTQQFNGLQEGQASIRERMTVVEQRLAADSS